MKAKQLTWVPFLLLLLGAALQLPAQQAKVGPKQVEDIKAKAEQGEAKAQFDLGICYSNGEGVTKDAAEAVKWYRKAAEQGFAMAQCNLGVCYEKGQGVAKEAAEAVKWYREAAEQGLALAQCNLGVCYAKGEGVATNYVESYKWFSVARAQGDEIANAALISLSARMTPEQIAQAYRLAREFKSRTASEQKASPPDQPPRP